MKVILDTGNIKTGFVWCFLTSFVHKKEYCTIDFHKTLNDVMAHWPVIQVSFKVWGNSKGKESK